MKTYGADLSRAGKTEKFGDWDRPDTKTGHIRADSFLALVASSYLIVTRSKTKKEGKEKR